MRTNGMDGGGSQDKAEMRPPFHPEVGLRTMERLWQDLAEPVSTLLLHGLVSGLPGPCHNGQAAGK
jgi:hypothetical protein